jgi:peptide deformylase
MILPVTAYGHPTLKKVAGEIDEDYPNLGELIENMFETMYAAEGVGLAAPQVNKSIRLFIVDATPYADEIEGAADFKKILINPYIVEEEGEEFLHEEGCLSIPHIREQVSRKPNIRIEYYDENWKFHEEEYNGMLARIIQHEYDHLEGKLFVEKISSLRKTLLKRKLQEITKGTVKVDYKMLFPVQKKRK